MGQEKLHCLSVSMYLDKIQVSARHKSQQNIAHWGQIISEEAFSCLFIFTRLSIVVIKAFKI